MYKRKDFQMLMPEGFDIIVHISNIPTTPTHAVHLTIKGTNTVTGLEFEDTTTEIFHPKEVADTVERLLTVNGVTTAKYTDVYLWQ